MASRKSKTINNIEDWVKTQSISATKTDNGTLNQQIKIQKIEYNYQYSNIYNSYGEKSNYLSYLRLGVLLGTLNNIPNSILDVGYGNGAFLRLLLGSY